MKTHTTQLDFSHDNYILRDHRVHAQRIVPGVTYLDLTLRAAQQLRQDQLQLQQVLFIEPLITTPDHNRRLEIRFEPQTETRWKVLVRSRKLDHQGQTSGEWTDHMEAILDRLTVSPAPTFDVQQFIAASEHAHSVADMYREARKIDIYHGTFMQTEGTLYLSGQEELMVLHLSELAEKYRTQMWAHPAFLDGASFSGSGFELQGAPGMFSEEMPFIPFSIDKFEAHRPFPEKIYVHSVRPQTKWDTNSEIIPRTYQIYDSAGTLLARFDRLISKRIRHPELILGLVQPTVPERPAVTPTKVAKAKLQSIVSEPSGDPEQAILTWLKENIGQKIEVSANEVEEEVGFYALGLDSRQIVEIVRELEEVVGHGLYPTLLFEHQNVRELTTYLLEKDGVHFLNTQGSEPAPQREPSHGTGTLHLFDFHWEPEPLIPAPSQRPSDDQQLILIAGGSALLADKLKDRLALEVRAIPDMSESAYFQFVWEIISAKGRTKSPLQLSLVYPNQQAHNYSFISGLLKTAHKESPMISGKLIGVEALNLPHFEELVDVLANESRAANQTEGCEEVRYQEGIRKTRKLNLRPAMELPSPTGNIQPGGVYLITGGGGGLGLIFARHISQTPQTRIILVGRSPLSPAIEQKVEGIPGVEYLSCDISSESAVTQLIHSIKQKHGKLNGILHAAGVTRDSLLVRKTVREMEAVLAPKIAGTQNLDRVTRKTDLDFMVLFSSTTGAWGNVGQADYAAANAYLDHFAQHRNLLVQQGMRKGNTLSINWPLWSKGGMRMDADSESYLKKQEGILPLPTDEGILAFEMMMQSGKSQMGAIFGDPSLLANRFGLKTQVPTPATPIEKSEPIQPRPSTYSEEPIAVIGLSGKYPGANNLDEFWDNLNQGVNSITEIPLERWDKDLYFDQQKGTKGKSYSKWGGFVKDADKFDPLFFNMAPREAENLDPQARLFLEESWKAIEDAGYTPKRLANGNPVGVFAGVFWTDYQLFRAEAGNETTVPGSFVSMVPNVVSYHLGFSGPSIGLDTQCSSSLTALHLACDSLRKGESQVSLAGGVTLSLHPSKYNWLSNSLFLSTQGQCQTFGEGGDGYVPAEGVGVAVLKTLSQAEADGDRIYGIIRSTAINHGGRSSGFTVPNPKAQSAVIHAAIEKAGIQPEDLTYLEAHGTGTALGDPIEISGLVKAFATDNQQYCRIGSVKSNIGHCEAAAGIAGITKVLLQMKHQRWVPSLHSEILNPKINFADSPFIVQQTSEPWELNGQPSRIAGVSSFGAGGSNAHVILEEYIGDLKPAFQSGNLPLLILLSARTSKQLKTTVQRLLDFLKNHPKSNLYEVAYTLQMGRKPLRKRLAFGWPAGEISHAQLIQKLQSWLATPADSSPSKLEGLDANWHTAATEWLTGQTVDWANFYPNTKPERISLPPYPFARDRYWYNSFTNTNSIKHKTTPVNMQHNFVSIWETPEIKALSAHTPGPEIQVKVLDGGIAWVQMESRESRNMFTYEFVKSLQKTFLDLRERKDLKVVVLTGYDNVFCMGGSEDVLNDIAEKKNRFTDIPFLYRGFLEFEVPVITAMQGHAFGGGMLFGLYGDIVLMSEEATYTANFMKYGFTPGMGATYILGEKLGKPLATEMMFTAKMISGAQIRDRGASVIVTHDVQEEALRLARELSTKPRKALEVLKRNLSKHILAELLVRIEEEEEMHDQTFSGTEVETRISGHFQKPAPAPQKPQAPPAISLTPAAPQKSPEGEQVIPKLKQIFEAVIHISEDELELETSFVDLGVDSISGVELIRAINEKFGLNLEAVVLYDYHTLTKLSALIIKESGWVNEQLAPTQQPVLQLEKTEIKTEVVTPPKPLKVKLSTPTTIKSTSPTEKIQLASTAVAPPTPTIKLSNLSTAPSSVPSKETIALEPTPTLRKRPEPVPFSAPKSHKNLAEVAVIGMSGRFPGAKDVNEFWENLKAGKNSISEVPAHKWSHSDVFNLDKDQPGSSYSKWLGSLEGEDLFDAGFFNISPREAERMDPQQRILLEETWKAIEDAGYAAGSLAGTKCGVFVGVGQGDYLSHLPHEALDSLAFTGSASSILAGRIAYYLDLQGPAISVDTACSSSLVAMHQACQSIRLGESETALAGGVYVMTTEQMHIMTSKAGMLSETGQCYTFDNRANGFVPGEAVGVLMLKSLEAAQRDGDRIYGVIKGSGTNQDGRTNGITAPSFESQTRLQTDVYDRFNIHPETITYVEAHGTGTKLGDPIEMKALKQSFRKYTQQPQFCGVGSVKTNIGHTLTAAGICSAIKVLKSLANRQLPPSLNYDQLNEHIELKGSPFYINSALKSWEVPLGQPRRAAVSSFGFSGTNSHVVFEEYQPQHKRTSPAAGPFIFPLSARNKAQLKAYAQQLWDFMDTAGSDLNLEDLAYTLQKGREAMEERLAFVAKDLREAMMILQRFLDGNISSVITGNSKDAKTGFSLTGGAGQAYIQYALQHRETQSLIQVWAMGISIDWTLLYPGEKPRIISAPTYPFQRKSYWLDRKGWSQSQATTASSPPKVALNAVPVQPQISLTATSPEPALTPLPKSDNIRAVVVKELGDLLYMEPEELTGEQEFSELGLDSILGVELVKSLNRRLNIDLQASKLYEYTTIEALTEYIRKIATPQPDSIPVAQPQPQAQTGSEVMAILTQELCDLLYMDAEELDPTTPFHELGLDSILGVEWIKAINKSLGTDLKASRIYDYPSLEAFATGLALNSSVQAVPSSDPTTSQLPRQFEAASATGNLKQDGELSIRYVINTETNACLRDHRVFDQPVLSTDAFLEMVYAASREYLELETLQLSGIRIHAPLVGTEKKDYEIDLVFKRLSDGRIRFSISSHTEEHPKPVLHLRGFLNQGTLPPESGLSVSMDAAGKITHPLAEQELSQFLATGRPGIYDGIRKSLNLTAKGGNGRLELAAESTIQPETLIAQWLDGALLFAIQHATLNQSASPSAPTVFLPYQLNHFTLYRPAETGVSYSCDMVETGQHQYNLIAKTPEGEVLFYIQDLELKPVAKTQLLGHPDLPTQSVTQTDSKDIAIIGLGCRFPEVDHADGLWERVVAGSLAKEPEVANGWLKVKEGDLSRFGAVLGMNEVEFNRMGRQQQLVFGLLGQAMEESGISKKSLKGTQTGVFIAASQVPGADSTAGDATAENNSVNMLPTKISYQLDLHGPSELVNTSCTSAYAALDRAMQSIRTGDCDQAIVGGVNVITTESYGNRSDLVALLSDTGGMKSFSDDADGIVHSEGAGILMLKPLPTAEKDGNPIFALVKGTGFAHGGKNLTWEAPNPKGIKAAIRKTMDRAGVEPGTIDYIEVHGIANRMADAIELSAINDAYKEISGESDKKWHISSIKPTIGHPELASGIASLIKAVKALQHKIIPGIPHFGKPNSELDPQHSMVMQSANSHWENGSYPRRAALNSFAVGGINAHVVLEEYKASAPQVNLSSKPEQQTSLAPTPQPASNLLQEIILEVFDLELDTIDRKATPVDYDFDSVKLIRFVRRINEAMGINLKMGKVLALENFGAFFDLIDQELARLETEKENLTEQAIPSVEEVRYPLSEGQKGLWFIQELDPQGTSYNMPLTLSFQGKIETEVIQQNLQRILHEHPALTANFHREGESGELVQVIRTGAPTTTLNRQTLESGEDLMNTFRALSRIPFQLHQDSLLKTYIRDDESNGVTHLLFVIHHIVFDGMSSLLFLQSFMDGIQQGASGVSCPLVTPNLGFFDFLTWEQSYLQGAESQEAFAYWKSVLKTPLPKSSLPYDFQKPEPGTPTQVGSQALTLDRELVKQLKETAKDLQVNMSILLLGVFHLLLHRLTGDEEILVLTPTAGRPKAAHEKSIGYFINMMVLRTALPDQISFPELLQALKQQLIEGIDHAAYPFPRLMSELGIRVGGPDSGIKAGYAYQNLFEEVLNNEVILESVKRMGDLYQENDYDYSLEIFDLKEDFRILLKFNKARFLPETITRHTHYFERLLTAIVQGPNQPIDAYEFLSEADKHQLLVTWNDTQTPFPDLKPAHIAFEGQAAKNEDQVALWFEGKSMSYRQLDRKSNRLAHYLRKQGVAHGDLISVCLDRSIDLVVAILGVLKAGGAYVPIDPTYPADRIGYILEDTQTEIVITHSDLEPLLPEKEGLSPILLDKDRETILRQSTSALKGTVSPENLMYVIYTSGSTGRPKGVLLEHGGLMNYVRMRIEMLGLQPGDKILQFASIGFDASCSEIFSALLSGSCLVIPRKEDLLSAERIKEMIREHELQVITLPPSYQAVIKEDLYKLNTLVSVGEALNVSLTKELQAKGIRVLNGYGPTENTVGTTISEDPVRKDGTVTIGKPMQNVQVFVLDKKNRLVPPGVAGELCVGGAQVARGYLNRPDLNAAKFIPNPYPTELSPRLYKTGDLARWLPDGNLEFLGRIDDQVKIRGHRVELQEIEQNLSEFTEVEQAVVVLNEQEAQAKLVAFYTPRKKVEFWPSLAEFLIFDDIVYRSMSTHTGRIEAYREALKKVISGKTVLEIGPGPEAVLACLCIECGAKHVYAVEILEEAYLKSKRKVESLGLSHRITMIHSDIQQAELPEKVDYCVAGIVGSIGGSEGAGVLINAARKFLKDPKNMIPERSVTRIAAISLEESTFEYGFSAVANHYVSKIFDQYDKNLELRICLKNLPSEQIISTHGIFEDLDYTQEVELDHTHEISLNFTQDGIFNGFQVWLDLFVDEENRVNILEDAGSWLPVYFPVSYPGHAVSEGDFLKASITRKMDSSEINPDYFLEGTLVRLNGEEVNIAFQSYSHKTVSKFNRFHQQLLNQGNPEVLEAPGPAQFRQFLGKTLPDYMLPSAFIKLEALPLTPNKKVDRKALAQREVEVTTNREYTPPRNEVERKLVAIWEKLLLNQDNESQAGQIGIEDDFFELGGHSLLATRAISAIRKSLQMELVIKDLFAHPTVKKLARFLQGDSRKSALPTLTAQPRGQRIPLSYSQEQLWFIHQLEGSAHYHMPMVFNLSGDLNPQHLEQAIQWVLDRHEVLRTVVNEVEGQAYQEVLSAQEWQLTTTDNFAGSVDELIQETIQEPFHLGTDYPIRAHLIQESASASLLVLVIHHIAADGWSIPILLRELSEALVAQQEGRKPALPTLELQYADHAIWQRKYLTQASLAADLDHWEATLSGLEPLKLHTDLPRPALPTQAGASLFFQLEKADVQGLKNLARETGSTLFMASLTVFKILLMKYSGQQDICVGSPVANRQQEEIEPLIGFFVNTLPLRTQLDNADTFRELLEQVKNTTLEAYSRQQVPLEKIVERVGTERDPGRNPLFQVMFILQSIQMDRELKFGDLHLSPRSFDYDTSKFDLTFDLTENEKGITVRIEYGTDLFHASTVERMMAHFRELIASVTLNPDTQLKKLSMLTVQEEQQLISGFNPTGESVPEALTVTDLFETQAQQTPALSALVMGEQEWTYEELNKRANVLAHHLLQQGVKPGDKIGIAVPRSAEMVAGVIGILKCDCAYVPLDPEYPAHRLQSILADTGLTHVVTLSGLELALPWENLNRIHLNELNNEEKSSTNPVRQVVEMPVCYILFTSGSTGQPKGVQMSHHSLVNLLMWQQDQFEQKSGRRVLQFASLNFDVSFQELFSTLCFGGTLCLVEEEERKDPKQLLTLIQKQELSHLFLPFVMLEALAETAASEGNYPESLDEIITAGEQLKLTAPIEALINQSSAKLINHYGPTESHVATAYTVQAADFISKPLPPIGKPIWNTPLFVLDPNGELAGLGVPGELCIAGRAISPGYVGRAALTAERFVTVEIGGTTHRMYRTGDQVRWTPDGNLEFLGRLDGQVKINGFRVEPAEVETVLHGFEGVTQCTVQAKKDGNGRLRLVAYLVAGPEYQKEAAQDYLRAHLPAYMMPAFWVELEALPVNNNGKVDKAALPDPESLVHSELPYVPAATEMEEALVDIWKNVLGLEGKEMEREIGVMDNFFDLGGHSLLTIRLVSQINAHFGTGALELIELMQNPTIQGITRVIKAKNSSARSPWTIRLRKGEGADTNIIVPGMPGLSEGYLEMAKGLPGSGPAYGLQMKGHRGDTPAKTLTEMAAHNLAQIRALNLKGKINLYAHSYGGTVVYEMMKQWASTDPQVDRIVLIDTAPHKQIKSLTRKSVFRFCTLLLTHSGVASETLEADLHKILRHPKREWKERLGRFLSESGSGIDTSLFQRFWDLAEISMRASHKITDQLDFPVHFVLARENPSPYSAEAWDKAYSSVRVIHSKGDHFSIVQAPDCHRWLSLLEPVTGRL